MGVMNIRIPILWSMMLCIVTLTNVVEGQDIVNKLLTTLLQEREPYMFEIEYGVFQKNRGWDNVRMALNRTGRDVDGEYGSFGIGPGRRIAITPELQVQPKIRIRIAASSAYWDNNGRVEGLQVPGRFIGIEDHITAQSLLLDLHLGYQYSWFGFSTFIKVVTDINVNIRNKNNHRGLVDNGE